MGICLLRCLSSAALGSIQTASNCSLLSGTGVCPSGMRATKKGTAKRLGRWAGAVKCPTCHSAAASSRNPVCCSWGHSGAWRSSASTSACAAGAPSARKASSTPISSRVSRRAATVAVRVAASISGRNCTTSAGICPSCASMQPPGKTYMPGPKLAALERRVIRTSQPPSGRSRSSSKVEAASGSLGTRWG